MKKQGLIEENLNSNNVFIKNLYTDLDGRIQEFENGGSRVEKMKVTDAKGTFLIVSSIVAYLVTVIIW